MVMPCARIRQATAARRVRSCETDCRPLDPTPSPSELAIRSRLRWPAWAIAWIAVTAAGMSTGNKMIRRTMAIENIHLHEFGLAADQLARVLDGRLDEPHSRM